MQIKTDNTIAAVATAAGAGGIGIVRISGSKAIEVLSRIFVPVKNKDVKRLKTHTVTYGHIYDGEKLIDEVLAVVMRAPNTYTREDVVEINCHGGIRAVTSVLETVLKNGADMAEPGEFTKRAFLNGRIDLSQAEAVIDVINAKTELSQRAALSRLDGKLSELIRKYRDDILTMTAHIEASIDYPEHDDEAMTYETIYTKAKSLLGKIKGLLKTADTGKIIREGIKAVILGKPNVGKSSLLNSLIKEERAIVTDIPGTTRDILQEYININGVPLNITDTAGIRDTDDVIEKLGVDKSKKYAEEAELVFLVIDGSRELEAEDFEILKICENKKTITIINKADLPVRADIQRLYEYVDKDFVLSLSVKGGIGFELLFEKLKQMFFDGEIDVFNEPLISNERNKASLNNAINSLNNALETIETRMPEDFISMDLMDAYKFLGEITGEAVEEDIIDKIFSEFCLGK